MLVITRVTLCLLLASLAASPQERPAGPKKPGLYADYKARRLRLFQDTFLSDYRSRRKPGEPPDARTEAFLNEILRRLFEDTLGEDLPLRHLQWLTRSSLHRSGEDPLVLFAAGAVAHAARNWDLTDQLLRSAGDGLAKCSSPPLLQHFVQLQFLGHLESVRAPRDRLDPVRKRCHDLLVQAIADPRYGGANQRIYVDFALQTFDGQIPAWAAPLVERMARTEGAHPCALATIQGMYHVSAAWEARGSGTVDTVSEAGWRNFKKHLEQARQFLTAAHERDPAQPESAVTMITVAGGLDLEAEEREAWFERAVAAEFDNVRAYSQFLHFLRPRWGGSHEDMLRFAREWAATARFDTRVPDLYRDTLALIAEDFDTPTELFRPMGVQRTLQTIHAGYLAQPLAPRRRLAELSEHVVVLTLGQRARQAAQVYQTMDGEFDDRVLPRYGMKKDALIAALEPHLTPHLPRQVTPTLRLAGHATTRYDPLYAAQPLIRRPGTSTSADVQRGWEEWTVATWQAAYDRHGQHDAAWDAKVRKLISAYPRFVQGAAAEVPELASEILVTRCEDPLVRYAAARVRQRSDAAGAQALLEQAITGFTARSYPQMFLFYSRRQLEAVLRARGRKAEADALLAQVADHAVAMATDPGFAGAAARYYVTTVVPDTSLGWGIGPMTETAIERLAANDAVDPWIRKTMVGLHHAARASGSGVEPFPAQARAEYFEDVRKAAEALTAAWALRPEFPEPAAAMIVVAGLEPGELVPRVWFERAVALQFDLRVAYNNFVWMLRPDWGGSIPAMYRFAVECLQTREFATDVPLVWRAVAETVAGMLDSPRSFWAVPEVAAHLDVLADGIAAARKGSPLAAQLAAGRYLTAWAGGRYDAALRGWEGAGKVIDASWLAAWKTTKENVTAEMEYLAAQKRR